MVCSSYARTTVRESRVVVSRYSTDDKEITECQDGRGPSLCRAGECRLKVSAATEYVHMKDLDARVHHRVVPRYDDSPSGSGDDRELAWSQDVLQVLLGPRAQQVDGNGVRICLAEPAKAAACLGQSWSITGHGLCSSSRSSRAKQIKFCSLSRLLIKTAEAFGVLSKLFWGEVQTADDVQ